MNILLVGKTPVLRQIEAKIIDHGLSTTEVPSFASLKNLIGTFNHQNAPIMVIGYLDLQKDNPEIVTLWKRQLPGCRFFALVSSSALNHKFIHLTQYFDGIALNTEDLEVIGWAIRKVHQGGKFISPELNRLLLQSGQQSAKVTDFRKTRKILTQHGIRDREIQIIDLLEQNLSYKEISNVLHLSVNTVRHYTYLIYKKLNVDNRNQLKKMLNIISQSTTSIIDHTPVMATPYLSVLATLTV